MAIYAGGALLFAIHSMETYRRGRRQEAGASALVVSGLVVLLARGLRVIPEAALAEARLTGSVVALLGIYLLFRARRAGG
jgi:hypothetical protein